MLPELVKLVRGYRNSIKLSSENKNQVNPTRKEKTRDLVVEA